ncbi:hypothetical protein PICSAR35_04397 [Mycobacterium avium subsp. paratuberculosis]|nr:hypothetical protein PICSAR138_03808 [Mycobacterium avium subsp. paratuberculosis]CAG7430317.1 hypothetical protein PICSAR97_02305 [Mycobacterium avium subsp. paratuberculosis]CAG7462909.1 hypothetical protein PICSAR35_04397 [Mycobacterium avium subsp. paratuberculosis]
MPQPGPVDRHAVAVQLAPAGHRPHVGGHVPLVGQHLRRVQRRRHGHPGGQDLRLVGALFGGHVVAVEAAQQALGIEVLRLRRLHVRLVVDGDVEVHVLGVLAEHPCQPALHDVGDLVGERRVVGDHGRVGGGQQQRVAVGVLQALAGQGGAPRRRAEQEAACHLVGGGPQPVTGALEAEHRIEDVDRDHRLVVRGIRRPGRDERSHRSGFVDALVQDLPDFAFLVRQHQFGVHGGVQLAVAVVDLQRREPGVHAEGARLVGNDRHDPRANLLVPQYFFEGAHRRHGGGDLLGARPLLQCGVDVAAGKPQCLCLGAAFGQKATQGAAPVEHVADLGGIGAGVVVGRQIGILVQLGVADRNAHRVPEVLEVFQRKLFHLMRGVAALEVRAQRVALDGLGQDHRGLALVVDGGPVGGIHLAVVVAAALEVPDLGVGHVLHQRLGARVAAEEMVAHVGAVVGLVGLVIPVGRGVHQVHQRAVPVGVQQGVPLAAPDHLDDVPAGAAEERLQFLNDLAVAAHRAVEALQVAVDHERQVVQRLVGGHLDQTAAFRLVHLAVAQEAPHVLIGGVLDAAVMQVVVEPRLINGVQRAQAHRHRGEFPEVGHQPWVRVGRQAAAGVAVLLAEAVELVGGQPALQEGARVDPRGGVALDEDLVAAAGMRLAAEEVVEADFVQRRRRRVGRNVAAHTDSRPLRAVHHDGGVPPDPRPVAPFDVLVAGEPRLEFGGNGVDVVGGGQRREGDPLLAGAFQQPQHQIAGP